jgi:NCAIR mutase (PurE)-related protein
MNPAMNREQLTELMERVRAGETTAEEAVEQLRDLPYEDIGFAKVDHHRALRRGFPETVFAESKTPAQVIGILRALVARSDLVIASRASAELFDAVRRELPEARYHDLARIIRIGEMPEPDPDKRPVAVVTAGTSDLPVAEEAAVTAEVGGCRVVRVDDVGVAGLHRLLAHREELLAASVIIVVAGMEPTSVGYGAAFEGLAALLGMLNSCASGVVVVNIDNGFGAGRFAAMVNGGQRAG